MKHISPKASTVTRIEPHVPHVIYAVEDNKGTVYTAHISEDEAREDGETMQEFAQQNSMDIQFFMQAHTLH